MRRLTKTRPAMVSVPDPLAAPRQRSRLVYCLAFMCHIDLTVCTRERQKRSSSVNRCIGDKAGAAYTARRCPTAILPYKTSGKQIEHGPGGLQHTLQASGAVFFCLGKSEIRDSRNSHAGYLRFCMIRAVHLVSWPCNCVCEKGGYIGSCFVLD